MGVISEDAIHDGHNTPACAQVFWRMGSSFEQTRVSNDSQVMLVYLGKRSRYQPCFGLLEGIALFHLAKEPNTKKGRERKQCEMIKQVM